MIAAVLSCSLPLILIFGGLHALPGFALLAGAATFLALLGGIDDIRPLSPAIRLLAQILAVTLVVRLADPGRILPEAVPIWLERTFLVLAGAWWVNLVNFMDGIDWITVAEFVPLTGAVVLLGLAGILPPGVAGVAACLLGALLGFAPSNRPVAGLFLGDVGSLPIGLLSGWMLLELAKAGHLAAALLLPLYYLADATLTLGLRARRGERVWTAHRSHFYQRALDRGLCVIEVDRHVFGLNLVLAGLAAGSVWVGEMRAPALALGAVLVALTLRRFASPAR